MCTVQKNNEALDICCSHLCLSACSRSCIPDKIPYSTLGGLILYRCSNRMQIFCHRVWLEAGCPTAGVLFQIKRASKRRFKYEVRRLNKLRRQHITRKKLAAALASSNSRDFWKEAKKVNMKSKTSSSVPTVDGISGDAPVSRASKLICKAG